MESLDNYLELGKVRRVEIAREIGLFVRIEVIGNLFTVDLRSKYLRAKIFTCI